MALDIIVWKVIEKLYINLSRLYIVTRVNSIIIINVDVWYAANYKTVFFPFVIILVNYESCMIFEGFFAKQLGIIVLYFKAFGLFLMLFLFLLAMKHGEDCNPISLSFAV